MNKKRLLLPLLLLATTLATLGQTLQGRFCDEGGNPLEFVNVVALQPADSTFVQGTVTATDGRFSLNGLPEGNYLLRATSVGYAPFYLLCHPGELGTLTLQADGGEPVFYVKVSASRVTVLTEEEFLEKHPAES